ncbi:MAG: TusE/DsrC/DsvC family sulfur relay protein [Cyclobacteriaceae bacterium]
MSERNYAETLIDCNEEGYLNNLDQWSRDVAVEIAKEEGIELQEKHWEVLEYLQNQYKSEIPITIRKVGKSGVVDIKQFYQLFPDGPLKKASRIAGIRKPVSCI